MSTLLLRLSGPLQSWGVSSKFNNRSTEKEPSKSGVIGMVASALGRPRDAPLDDLSALRFGVRVDQPGKLIRDYHTAHNPEDEKLAYITNRYYLSDATFLVGLEGDREMLEGLDQAIQTPFYPLFLGRRSCPPSGKISLGIRDANLEEALASEPWLASDWYAKRQPKEISLDVVIDSQVPGCGYLQKDNPISFSEKNRRYSTRAVQYRPASVHIVNARGKDLSEKPTTHDPFTQFRED